MPVTGAESWTVVGDDGGVVVPAERYLAHLSALERSPDTVRAYALSLRLWFEFLGQAGVGWAGAGAEDVARFVAWLRAPAGNVIVLEGGTGQRSAATVNRHLAAVFGLYDHLARDGAGVAASLVAWRRVSRGSYKPFLHHVTRGKAIATRPVKLAVTRRVPRTLDAGQVAAVLAACDHLRDRFLLALLAGTGMRVGQALGLRHADFVSRDRQVRIVPRADNANGKPVPRSMNWPMPLPAIISTARTRNSRLATATCRPSGTTDIACSAASRSASKLSLPPR
jgi:integrase